MSSSSATVQKTPPIVTSWFWDQTLSLFCNNLATTPRHAGNTFVDNCFLRDTFVFGKQSFDTPSLSGNRQRLVFVFSLLQCKRRPCTVHPVVRKVYVFVQVDFLGPLFIFKSIHRENFLKFGKALCPQNLGQHFTWSTKKRGPVMKLARLAWQPGYM